MPLAPHIIFTQFLDDKISEERALGMLMGLELLKRCQGLWTFGNRISDGMLGEIDAAKQLEIPIHYYSDRCERRDNPYER